MPKLNPLRPLTTEERATTERLAHARTEAMRRGERARIILAAEGETARVVAPPGHGCEASVHYRRKRFNEVLRQERDVRKKAISIFSQERA